MYTEALRGKKEHSGDLFSISNVSFFLSQFFFVVIPFCPQEPLPHVLNMNKTICFLLVSFNNEFMYIVFGLNGEMDH